MIKKFEDFLSNESVDESNENKVIVKYRWLDYYNDKWYVTECEVIKRKKRTADIKLLGWGPKGRKPGDIMQVHLKSLIGLENGLQKKKGAPDLSWRKATDPDTFKSDDDEFDDINEGIKNSVERDSEAKNLVGIAKKYFADTGPIQWSELCENRTAYAVHWRIRLTMPTFMRMSKPSTPGRSEPVMSIMPLRESTRMTSLSISSRWRMFISFFR